MQIYDKNWLDQMMNNETDGFMNEWIWGKDSTTGYPGKAVERYSEASNFF
jgi:hypothetical protein